MSMIGQPNSGPKGNTYIILSDILYKSMVHHFSFKYENTLQQLQIILKHENLCDF